MLCLLLEEINKSDVELTLLVLIFYVMLTSKGGQRTGKDIIRKISSIAPSRGELASVYARLKCRANDSIVIEQITTESCESWRYKDFSVMKKVLLKYFKLMEFVKEHCIKIGIVRELHHGPKSFECCRIHH
jgi:hypothetical protein